jgi:hypothetical protein
MTAKKDPDAERGSAKRVVETGIALVHEGELVLPAAGDEAQAMVAADDARSAIHYHFPVEIEVRGAPEPVDPERLATLVFERLARRLRRD